MKYLGPIVAALAISTSGCGGTPTLEIEVTSGMEEGMLADDPAVTEVVIRAFEPIENGLEIETSAGPGESFELGEVADSKLLVFELTGKTAEGEVAARGRSVAVSLASELPSVLPIFIQRLGSFARLPTGIARPHVRGQAAVLGERYLLLTGGERAFGEGGEDDVAFIERYDLMLMSGESSASLLDRTAKTMLVLDDTALLIGDDGATFQNLVDGSSSTATAPEDFSFGDVAGGMVVDSLSDDGPIFVVGGTRTSEPSDVVFVVDRESGGISAVRLAEARLGAAAIYVAGTGLVVVGGSGNAPGVEIVREDDLTVTALPLPADTTTGAAVAIFGTDEHKIAVVGGRMEGDTAAPSRVLDVACVTADDCAEKVVTLSDAATLSELATSGRAFATPRGVLAVGETTDGETIAFLVDVAAEAVTSLPLREPRRGATALPAPNGTLALIGGETLDGNAAHSIELFFPE